MMVHQKNFWHRQRLQYRSVHASERLLRVWEGDLGKPARTWVQRFETADASARAVESLLTAWQAEGFLEQTVRFETDLPLPQRWSDLPADQCVARLAARGFEFTLRDFKRSMRLGRWEPPEIFELFLAGGILKKLKVPDSVVREAIDHGTPAMAMALLEALPAYRMDGEYFARRVMMEAQCLEVASPCLRQQWRELVLALLERVDDVDVPYLFKASFGGKSCEELFTPLRCALQIGALPLVERLLGRKLDIDRRYPDQAGGTILHVLCAMRDPEPALALCLLRRGVPLEARDDQGRTALGVACSNRHDEPLALVRCLVEQGAQVLACQSCEDDRTALTLSLYARHYGIADFIVDHCEHLPRTASAPLSPAGLALRQEQATLAEKIYLKGGYKPLLGLGGSLGAKGGLLVERVGERSAAASVGVQAGDVILKVSQIPVSSWQELVDIVHAIPVGAAVALQIARNEELREVSVPVQAC